MSCNIYTKFIKQQYNITPNLVISPIVNSQPSDLGFRLDQRDIYRSE